MGWQSRQILSFAIFWGGVGGYRHLSGLPEPSARATWTCASEPRICRSCLELSDRQTLCLTVPIGKLAGLLTHWLVLLSFIPLIISIGQLWKTPP